MTRPVHYVSDDRAGGLRRLAISALTRAMHASDHDLVIREDLPDDLRFPPSSTGLFTKGASHYGIMIPDLPEPYRFLAHMVIIGATGFRAWDDDAAFVGRPRGVAQLGWGTAESDPDGSFHVFEPDEVDFADDGSTLRFGPDHRLDVDYPTVRLRSTLDGLHVDLTLQCNGEITWVADSGIYRHFSLMCEYEGTVGTATDPVRSVCGTGTFEYGIGYMPYMELPRPLPTPVKIPADFFTYHVLDLGPGEQIIACTIGAYGDLTAGMAADARKTGGGTRRIGEVAEFEVVEFADEPTSFQGRSEMHLPVRFVWTFRGTDGVQSRFEGEVDTRWLYAGMGYIGGYAWYGTIDGVERAGRAYIEYSDRRPRP